MAASTADALGRGGIAGALLPAVRRIDGVALVAVLLVLTVALIAFDWQDPSLNTATARLVDNPIGPLGAAAAHTTRVAPRTVHAAAPPTFIRGLSWIALANKTER